MNRTMKFFLIFLIAIFCGPLKVQEVSASSFLDNIRSGKTKVRYPKGYKPPSKTFREDIKSGKIKRNYQSGYKKTSKTFIEDVKSGKVKRNYAKGHKSPVSEPSSSPGKALGKSSSSRASTYKSQTPAAVEKVNTAPGKYKSVKKGFWGR